MVSAVWQGALLWCKFHLFIKKYHFYCTLKCPQNLSVECLLNCSGGIHSTVKFIFARVSCELSPCHETSTCDCCGSMISIRHKCCMLMDWTAYYTVFFEQLFLQLVSHLAVHCCVRKGLTLDLMLSHCTIPACFSKILFNIIFPPIASSPKWPKHVVSVFKTESSWGCDVLHDFCLCRCRK